MVLNYILSIGTGLMFLLKLKPLFAYGLYKYQTYTSVDKLGRRDYEASYWFKGKKYKLQMKIDPFSHVTHVTSKHDDKDITVEVAPYMGANQDFHRSITYPSIVREALYHTATGEALTFDEYINQLA